MAAYTIPQYMERLKKLRKELNKAVQKPFREEQRRIQGWLIKEYWKHDFGALIWNWRKRAFGVEGGPAVHLGEGTRPKRARWSQSEGAWIAPITVEGLAKAIEEGGRLRRYVPWGREQYAKEPGVAVKPRMPTMDRVIEAGWLQALDRIEESFAQFARRIL